MVQKWTVNTTHPLLNFCMCSLCFSFAIIFFVFARAAATHTLSLLLIHQREVHARWRRSITVTGGLMHYAGKPCVAPCLPLEMTLSVIHAFIQALLTYGDQMQQAGMSRPLTSLAPELFS